MRTIQPNYFIGVRLPWTLEDPDNWRQTHRMAPYFWIAGGLLLIILFPFFYKQTYGTIFISTVLAMALIPTIHSFYLYKKPLNYEIYDSNIHHPQH